MKEKKTKETEYPSNEPTELEATDAATTEEKESENSSADKLPPNVVEVRGRWWLKYLITTAVLAVFTVLVAWARGAFVETDQKELLGQLSDAFFVPGILAVCFGLLIVASNGGAFDILSYGVKSLFRLFKKDPLDRKYGGFYEYRKARQEKKRSFWYLVIVGGVFTLISGALLGWYLAV